MLLKIKQGDTFKLDAAVKLDGSPQSISGWTTTCQLNTKSGVKVVDLTVTVTDAANGEYQLTAPSGTTSWPIGTLVGDIQYDMGGDIVSTETFAVRVVKDETA
jgi:hypothetical protein